MYINKNDNGRRRPLGLEVLKSFSLKMFLLLYLLAFAPFCGTYGIQFNQFTFAEIGRQLAFSYGLII